MTEYVCRDCGSIFEEDLFDKTRCSRCGSTRIDPRNLPKAEASHAVLSEVRDELLADAIGLLMNHEQCKDDGWQSDYNELMIKYDEHFR